MLTSQRFGPGFLVAAAFIGPGTVTTASLAGAQHGFALAWAVVAAIGATLVLQEMAARLGAVFERSDALSGQLARVALDGIDCALLEPATFMNRSGASVASALSRWPGLAP